MLRDATLDKTNTAIITAKNLVFRVLLLLD